MTEDDDDDPEAEIQVRQVFAYFGRAAYAASCVETGLTVALMHAELMSQVIGRARRERKGPSPAEWEAMFDAYMAKHELLPLGTLIARFRSVVKVAPELDSLLDEARRRRNLLVHAFFREKAVAFAHSAGRIEMIDDLIRDHDLFTQAEEAIVAVIDPLIPKLGIDADKHRAQIEAITKTALAEARAKADRDGTTD